MLLWKVRGGVGFGVALLKAVRADTQGYDGEDEAQEKQSEEEVLALDLALDGLVLRALAGEMVGGLVVLGALLAGEELLGVTLNFQRTGDSSFEVGLEAIRVRVAVLVLAAADRRKRTGGSGLGVTNLALVSGRLGVVGNHDDLGVLE